MELDKRRFDVRIARDAQDVAAAQRLRYRVFVEEMGAVASEADHNLRLERDRFDEVFDHLILIDKALDCADPLDRVVGVYRLLPGQRAFEKGGFYGQTEYDLSVIERLPRASVELGRSCVAAEYRGGVAMHLLWNGLASYVYSQKIEIIFGVASFHGTDPAKISQALAYLHHNHLAPEDLRMRALPHAYVPMNTMPADQIDRFTALSQVPKLIKAYLRFGGFVGEGAFIDYDFNTIDVCLVMDTARMVDKYKSFYNRELVDR